MRERILILIILIVAVVPVALLALWPSADPDANLTAADIVEKAIAAHGGRAALGGLRSVRRSFSRVVPGLGEQSADLDIIYPDKLHLTMRDAQGKKIDEWVYHAPGLWRIDEAGNPAGLHPQESEAILMTINERIEEMDCRFLMQLPLRVDSLQYLRRVLVEDRNCHLVQEEIGVYEVINYYFDVDTFRLIKRERQSRRDRKLFTEEEFYSEYTETDGLWFPNHITHFINTEMAGEEKVKNRQVNVNISEDVFVYPK